MHVLAKPYTLLVMCLTADLTRLTAHLPGGTGMDGKTGKLKWIASLLGDMGAG